MQFKKICKGRALYVQDNRIWIAQGLDFCAVDTDGKRLTPKYSVGKALDRFISSFRLSRQLLRLGIHHLLPLNNGGFLVVLKKKTLVLDHNGNVVNIFSGYRGNKPGHRGVCLTPAGTVFFGEYTININNDNPTSLYRSSDNGLTFQNILTFAKDEVRHIHFVQWDRYENCLWMGTGDKDHECKLMRSDDNGDTWQMIGEGSQLWRAIGISITKDALYWGTDAGSVADPNFIIRMDRKTRELTKLQEVQGPCHGNAVLADETVFVSTGVEGGENERDRYAHLWKLKPGEAAREILKRRKDPFPLILQYGVMRFPMGLDSSDTLVFTSYALQGNGETVFVEGPGNIHE